MQLRRKILITIALIALVGGVVGVGTFSAFSSTTTNPGNTFAAGTVHLTDNDSGSAMYNVPTSAPGTSVTRCIVLTYGGTLPANVRLYTTSTLNALANYVDLTVEKGTSSGGSFPNCGTFTSQATIYSGTLAGFASAHSSYANGVSAYPGSQTQWDQNDTLVYRFTVSLQDDNNANGGATPLSTGAHGFTWEAQNQ
ncbi:MAG TPA: TasA family protein [Gaiellaceae bacterium]|nr:TasA family protein [Gaiella sp.]HEX2506175.1 TasA family protein [Gaiellaceae bacterium]